MKKFIFRLVLVLLSLPAMSQQKDSGDRGIVIKVDDANRKADVFFDGKYFTSYIYPASLEKTVLFPLTTSAGTIVTRGFPLQPRPGERVDHPHQVGWWFNYGDVNGLDFWNNSYAIPDSMKPHYGSIRHVRIVKTEGGARNAVLMVQCQWVDYQNKVLLDEETTFKFSGDPLRRRVVRTTTLTAVNGIVKFGDSKEGQCALRVDRAFEAPADKPEVFTDASGNPTAVPVLNNEGVNGIYRNSEGLEKDDVWGKRAKWVSLSARKGDENISLCLFDHPGNPGYPAYWHARGYGLFAINNLARKAYNSAEPENLTTLEQGESITFRYMLLIKSGGFMTNEDMTAESEKFVSSK
jgi:hypothetical protein